MRFSTLIPPCILLFTTERYLPPTNSFTIESKSFLKPSLSRNNKHHPIALKSHDILPHIALSGGDEPPKPLLRELIAEFIGTFIIVQIGCGTVCAAIFKTAQVGLWQIAAAWAIAVTLGISTTAAISGAHLNPAITIALSILRGFSWSKALSFIIAQILEAVMAARLN